MYDLMELESRKTDWNSRWFDSEQDGRIIHRSNHNLVQEVNWSESIVSGSKLAPKSESFAAEKTLLNMRNMRNKAVPADLRLGKKEPLMLDTIKHLALRGEPLNMNGRARCLINRE